MTARRHRAAQGRRDRNQADLVRALMKIPGVRVVDTGGVGGGFPDLVVGYKGTTYLVEVKNPGVRACDQALTSDQVTFHETWTGQVAVVRYLHEALALLGIPYKLLNSGGQPCLTPTSNSKSHPSPKP